MQNVRTVIKLIRFLENITRLFFFYVAWSGGPVYWPISFSPLINATVRFYDCTKLPGHKFSGVKKSLDDRISTLAPTNLHSTKSNAFKLAKTREKFDNLLLRPPQLPMATTPTVGFFKHNSQWPEVNYNKKAE